jgi:hypothetical protein
MTGMTTRPCGGAKHQGLVEKPRHGEEKRNILLLSRDGDAREPSPVKSRLLRGVASLCLCDDNGSAT